jgi:hypothetical protein
MLNEATARWVVAITINVKGLFTLKVFTLLNKASVVAIGGSRGRYLTSLASLHCLGPTFISVKTFHYQY